MYCKDCLSFGVCRYASGSRLLEKEPCADFMDIDKWVKLPCKAGDAVYVIYDGYVTCAYVLAFYIDKDGGMFDLCIKTKEEYAVGFKKVIDKNHTFSDIFLTQEEAERVLKERESNGQV